MYNLNMDKEKAVIFILGNLAELLCRPWLSQVFNFPEKFSCNLIEMLLSLLEYKYI